MTLCPPLISLLYVSEATSAPSGGEDPVGAIVEVALSRNLKLDVTGALLFTGPHFAQALEGPESAVDELMTSIHRDPRHCNVNVLSRRAINSRRFPEWNLAYAGPSLYVDRHLRPLVEKQANGTPETVMADRLLDLMCQFVRCNGPIIS